MPDPEIAKLDEIESAQASQDDAKAVEEGLALSDEPEEKVISPEVDSKPVEKGAQQPDPLPSDTPDIKTSATASPDAGKGTPEEAEKLVAKPDEEFDKELDEIQPTKGAHPGTKKALGVVKAKAKALNTNLREALDNLEAKSAKIAELEARSIPQEVEEKLKNLEHFQRTFGIEHDPEFVEKYDKKIEQIEQESLGFLKSLDLSEPIEKFITGNGGISAVRYSQKPIKDPQNPEKNITVEEWFNREILGNMDGLQRRKVESLISKELDLRDEKATKITEAKQNAESFISQKHQAFEGQKKAWFDEAEKGKNEFMSAMGPLANKIEIKPDMPEEEKVRAGKHNAQVDYVNETFPKLLADNTARGRAATAMSALQARYLTEYIQEMVPKLESERDDYKKKYEETKEFADKVKSSGRTAKQSNAAVDKKAPSKPLHLITDDTAMKELDKL